MHSWTHYHGSKSLEFYPITVTSYILIMKTMQLYVTLKCNLSIMIDFLCRDLHNYLNLYLVNLRPHAV